MKVEKIIRNKAGDMVFRIGVCKRKNKGTLHFKPEIVPHWDSLHSIRYDGNEIHECNSYYIPMFCQIFWLWWIFYIEVGKRKLGEHRMISYEDSHKRIIDEAFA